MTTFKLPELEKYEQLCPRCGGTGQIRIFIEKDLKNIPSLFEGIKCGMASNRLVHVCQICFRKGKISWIERIKNDI